MFRRPSYRRTGRFISSEGMGGLGALLWLLALLLLLVDVAKGG